MLLESIDLERSSHQKCSVKKMFFKISQNSQESTCSRVSFLATLLKKGLWHSCFPVNSVEFLRTPFLTEELWWLLLFIISGIANSSRNIHYQPHLPGFDLLLENNFETRNLNLFPNVTGQTGVIFSLLSNTISESQSSFASRRYRLS